MGPRLGTWRAAEDIPVLRPCGRGDCRRGHRRVCRAGCPSLRAQVCPGGVWRAQGFWFPLPRDGRASGDYENFRNFTGGETKAQGRSSPANPPICHSPEQPAWGLSHGRKQWQPVSQVIAGWYRFADGTGLTPPGAARGGWLCHCAGGIGVSGHGTGTERREPGTARALFPRSSAGSPGTAASLGPG